MRHFSRYRLGSASYPCFLSGGDDAYAARHQTSMLLSERKRIAALAANPWSSSVSVIQKVMKRARSVKQKVMGRPKTGTTPLMGFRADPETRAAIIRWAEQQPDQPTVSEAIRRLVELGLTVRTEPKHDLKQTPTARHARANELAAQAIDRISSGSSDNDQKASGKRRLIKGPEEFREVRLDTEGASKKDAKKS
jgi:hypothetical protein